MAAAVAALPPDSSALDPPPPSLDVFLIVKSPSRRKRQPAPMFLTTSTTLVCDLLHWKNRVARMTHPRRDRREDPNAPESGLTNPRVCGTGRILDSRILVVTRNELTIIFGQSPDGSAY